MNLSYWEQTSWLSSVDFTIVGSGIVGLHCALTLKKNHPKAKILILEKGSLPQGASTKNAGFACFGSLSEIISDLKSHPEEELLSLVQDRYLGIQSLRTQLGDTVIGYEEFGGHELFFNTDSTRYNHCLEHIKTINQLLHPVFKDDAFATSKNNYHFKNILPTYITHKFEGQIHTGKLMKALMKKVQDHNITILNSVTVTSFEDVGNKVWIKTKGFEFSSKKVCIATNGFASQLVAEKVKPARAQIIITKPIDNLKIKGTFHIEEGYYYFRNIGNRILLGGGRNLDFKTEETTDFGSTSLVRTKLENLLNTHILPNTAHEIDFGWSGIMGVGAQKKPIIKTLSENVACGVRLGGMGIAIGALVGQKLAHIFK